MKTTRRLEHKITVLDLRERVLKKGLQVKGNSKSLPTDAGLDNAYVPIHEDPVTQEWNSVVVSEER